jgi:hypothetical protein
LLGGEAHRPLLHTRMPNRGTPVVCLNLARLRRGLDVHDTELQLPYSYASSYTRISPSRSEKRDECTSTWGARSHCGSLLSCATYLSQIPHDYRFLLDQVTGSGRLRPRMFLSMEGLLSTRTGAIGEKKEEGSGQESGLTRRCRTRGNLRHLTIARRRVSHDPLCTAENVWLPPVQAEFCNSYPLRAVQLPIVGACISITRQRKVKPPSLINSVSVVPNSAARK